MGFGEGHVDSLSNLILCSPLSVKPQRELLSEEICQRGQTMRGSREDFPWVLTHNAPLYISIHLLYFPWFIIYLFHPPDFLEQEINRSPSLKGPLPPPCPIPSAPQPRELITIEEESERLARELKEVSAKIEPEELVFGFLLSAPRETEQFLGLMEYRVCFLLGIQEQR